MPAWAATVGAGSGLISGLLKNSAAKDQAGAYLAAAKLKSAGYLKAGQTAAQGALRASRQLAPAYTRAAGAQIAAGDKAILEQRTAGDSAIAEQRGQLDKIVGSMTPWTDMGRGATYSLADLYGLPTAQNPQGGQPLSDQALDAFRRSPDYQFAMDEAIKGADRTAAAKGGLISGGQQGGVARLASGLATQNYSNYFNRLLQLSQLGENASEYVGNARMTTGRDISDTMTNTARGIATTQLAQGDASARGILGRNSTIAAGISAASGARAAGISGSTSAMSDALQQASNIRAGGTSSMYDDISKGVSDAFNQASFLKYLQGGSSNG